MKKQILILLVFFGVVTHLVAQDARNTHFFSAPLQNNPALMGPSSNMNFILNYRNQWADIDDGYISYRFTFTSPILIQPDNKGKLDIGVSFVNDQAGAFNTYDAALSVGYNMKLTETGHFASLALVGSFVHRQLDTDGLTFDEQYQLGSYNSNNDNGEQLLSDNISYGSMGVGVLWYYKPANDTGKINAFAGLSWFQVNTPNESLTENQGEVPLRFNSIVGVKIPTKIGLSFMPMIQLMSQRSSQEFSTGLYMDYRVNDLTKLRFGTWYRLQDGFAPLFGIDVYKFSILYSYDFPSNGINDVISKVNTHEISFSFKLDMVEKKGGRDLWVF